MHSSLISKIQKANLYAREPERVRFDGVIDGRPTQMLFSGLTFVRRFS
jgi:hypothetical protein